MQEIEIEKYLSKLTEIKFEDLIPENHLFPNQKEKGLLLENQNKVSSEDEEDLDINYISNSPNHDSTEFSFDKKKIKEIYFAEKDVVIWDVFIRDELIIACGSKFIKIYHFNNFTEPDVTFLGDEKEDFQTMSYTETINEEGIMQKYIAVGGKKNTIKVIDILERQELHELVGHRNDITCLKFCPLKSCYYLLLSTSFDFSVRLWHAINKVQICIFGGPQGGHQADVLSVDWHLSGMYFVTSGIDHFIKIWEITENLQENIKKSILIKSKEDKKKHNFKIIIKCIPIFSTNLVHDNYVDCVKFNGNFIISKSINGIIYEWMPVFDKDPCSFFIINTYIYKVEQPIWYTRFNFELFKKLIAIGSDTGVVYLFKQNEVVSDQEEDKLDYFNKQYPMSEIKVSEKPIRNICIDELSNNYVVATSEGKIYSGSLINKIVYKI